jgi:hypothetical protein
LQPSHPDLFASSETPKPHERKSFELSKKIWRGYPCLRAALETTTERWFSSLLGLGDEVCEGVHGEDWEWEAEGDGRQVQGGEEVERERKY